MRPIPGTVLSLMYLLFGGLSNIGITLLLGWGFFAFSWWVPLASLIGCLFTVGFVYSSFPLGVAYVIVSFPISVALAILAITISR